MRASSIPDFIFLNQMKISGFWQESLRRTRPRYPCTTHRCQRILAIDTFVQIAMMQVSLALAALLGVALSTILDVSTITEVVSTVTATASVTASPVIYSAVPQFTDNSTFTNAVLNSTNYWRRQYNASTVAWNQTLAAFALSYLRSMGPSSYPNGTECDFEHSGGPYGENIALGCTEVTGCVDLCKSKK